MASRYNRQQLIENIARLHPELVFVRREKRQEALANGEMEVMFGRNSRVKPNNQVALVLDTHSLPGRGMKQTLNLATFVMPTDLALIETLELGQWQQGDVVTVDDLPYLEMQLIYAGRVVVTKREAALGEFALKPILEAVKANQYLPGFAKRRHQQIEHWKLYVALGLSESELQNPDVSFDSWFSEQLTTLELSEPSELDLFSDSDFEFRVSRIGSMKTLLKAIRLS